MTKVPSAAVSFGEYLERLMAERGFPTKTDLARAAKVEQTTIGRWMRGEMEPTLSGLRSIAPHLGVRLGDLIIAAGLATPAELGTVGSPPPPHAPLPPQLQRVVSIMLDPRVPEASKPTLLSAIGRTIELWEEMRQAPKEPRMRRTS